MTSHLRIQNILSILCLSVLLVTSLAAPTFAFDTPAADSPAEQLAFDDPGLYILNYYEPIDAMPAEIQQAVASDLVALGVPLNAGFYDLRANRWGSLVLTVPMVPGAGVGNALSWADLGMAAPSDNTELGQAARAAFENFVSTFSSQLRIDTSEFGASKVTVHEDGRLIQINISRVVDGIPVEGSWVHGVLNSGNLVLYGTRNWGDVNAASAPAISENDALLAASEYAAPAGEITNMRSPMLKLYPMKNGDTPSEANLGTGFDYRLTWEVQLSLAGSHGSWRALVDADSGEVYSFADQNRYATRKVTGGVQPVSNDGVGADGQEQDDWPMPFADIWINRAPGTGQPDAVTNSAGVMACIDGSIATRLAGPSVRMADTCGATNESIASGDLDLGSGATVGTAGWMPPQGTDCALPLGSSSAGNTHSSRDGFYEVNRIKEQARSWLPENFWLTGQLTSNMNINNTCNAFWNGSTINFYRDANSSCRNTGEIAAIFDHEWGHGMDANDAFPGIAFPGETTADQFAMFRLNTSCIGRGFFKGGPCPGQGDPCTECTGVREVDWTKRASGQRHNITWIKQATVTPLDTPLAPRGGCVASAVAIPVLQSGPCLQSTHCEGSVVSEAVWDLTHRDLNGFEGSAFTLDENTRINLVTRLGYLGGGNVNFWFQCVDTPEDGTGGCNTDGGYMNFLAVDDDNGNLLDGTPHMSAIHDAFARHQMACPAPIVADAGCAFVPATPSLTVTALDNAAQVEWDAVAGATEYWLFRADGINGCEFGKERIAVTTDTQFVDGELLNGRPYYYTVEAIGANDSCRSSASVCQTVIPTEGANLQIQAGSVTTEILGGDGDAFLDNCETALVSFELENSGNLPLTNVQIVSVESLSHPGVSAAETLPIAAAASLTDCDTAPASLTITGAGLSFGETLSLRIGFTADEFGGVVRTETVEIHNLESDFTPVASHTFAFNTFSDLEDWELTIGNYDQLPGGPTTDPSGFFLASSTFLPDQCDVIQSPAIKLSPTSTLSLWNQYDTEPSTPVFAGTYYDRANLGIVDTASGVRTPVVPDGGRPYDIPAAQAAGGSCLTTDQRGWSDAAQFPWQESTWSASALQAGAFAGDVVKLSIAYGTDPLVQGAGFQFDYITLTDFSMQGPDQQPDICSSRPVAVDDSATTPYETDALIDVIDNDDENGGGALTVTDVTDPSNGSVVNNNDGTVTYTPNGGFVGTDSFDYTVCNTGGCDTATVEVTVECPPAPGGSFFDDFESGAPGWTVDTALNTQNDLNWQVMTDLFAQSPDNSFVSGAINKPGVKDDRLVSPPMLPSATSQLVFWHRFSFAVGTSGPVDGAVLEVCTSGTDDCSINANWADITVSGAFVSGGYNGTMRAAGNPGVIPGRLAWTGLSTFIDAMDQVVVDLGAFDGSEIQVRWRNTGDNTGVIGSTTTDYYVDNVEFTDLYVVPPTCDPAPIANDDLYTVNNGETLTVATPGVLDNDVDNGSITAVLDSGPSFHSGTFTLNSDGSFTYTNNGSCPAPDEDDSFTYHANDGTSDSNIATVTIDVICNNPPDAVNDFYNVNDDATISVLAPGVLDNDSDPDGDTLEAELVSGPSSGTLLVFNADGSFEYQPDDTCGDGTDEFFYQACDRPEGDPERLCDTARVTINISDANLPPEPKDDAAATTTNTQVEIFVFGDNGSGPDSDPDGDSFTILNVTAPTCGGAAVHAPPPADRIVFTPPTDFTGTCSFSYTVCDECGLCEDAQVTVEVSEPDPFCGDGNVDPGEECDDGNNTSGDGCSATCEIEDPDPVCGDGNVDPGEECDDGNNTNGDGCSATCTNEPDPVCGDGNVDPGEECDDGNNTDGDGCSATCTNEPDPVCGDGNVDPGEECDDGNNTDGDGCSATCTNEPDPLCGDGTVDPGEECDDGNNTNGDGCSATCTIETTEPVPCDYCADDGDSDSETELALTYFGGDCSNSSNTQGSKAECTDFAGPPPSDQTVFVVVSSKEDSNSDSDYEYFRGPIDPGQGFLASAAFAGKDDLPSKVFVHIFDNDTESGGVILQTNEIHTSCSVPMIEGERFGAVALGDADNPGECTDVATGRVHGSGRLNVHLGPGDDEDSDTDADSDSDDDSDSDKIDFSFDAKVKKGELAGKLKLKDKEFDINIDADKDGITSLNTGTGDCNGQPLGANSWEFTAVGTFEQGGVETAATFRVCGEDNGKPGKGNDRFFLECTSGCAYDTGSRVPDDILDGGNIHIHDAIGGGA